jgi:hypothetical protein
MTWEWTVLILVLCGGFWSVTITIGEVERQAKRCAESLVNIDVTLDHIHTRLSLIEGELTEIRIRVAPRRSP